jgi:hypothetical protein
MPEFTPTISIAASDACSSTPESSDEALHPISNLKAQRDKLKRNINWWCTCMADLKRQMGALSLHINTECHEAWMYRFDRDGKMCHPSHHRGEQGCCGNPNLQPPMRIFRPRKKRRSTAGRWWPISLTVSNQPFLRSISCAKSSRRL